MLHQLEKAQAIARCSLSLRGSLHPATRLAVQELVNQVDVHLLERVDSLTTPTDANGKATVDVNISPDRLVLAVAKHHADRIWQEPHLVCFQIQHELLPVVDGLWSVSSALTRKMRGDVAGEQDDVDRLLDALLDEAQRMEKALASDQMKVRLQDLVRLRGYDQAVALPLHCIYASGPVTLAQFEQMMGHSARPAAKQSMDRLLVDGLLRNDGQGLKICFPLSVTAILKPESGNSHRVN